MHARFICVLSTPWIRVCSAYRNPASQGQIPCYPVTSNANPKIFHMGPNTQFLIHFILWLLSTNSNDNKLTQLNKPDYF